DEFETFTRPAALPRPAFSLWRRCPWRSAKSPDDAMTAWQTAEGFDVAKAQEQAWYEAWKHQADLGGWQTILRGLSPAAADDSPEPIEIRWLKLLSADGALPESLWKESGHDLAGALSHRDLAE